jgi:hypothetical protein
MSLQQQQLNTMECYIFKGETNQGLQQPKSDYINKSLKLLTATTRRYCSIKLEQRQEDENCTNKGPLHFD